MKRKSKGRVKKFEETGKVLSFPDERERAWDADTGEYDMKEFMAEGWRNVEREDALTDRPADSDAGLGLEYGQPLYLDREEVSEPRVYGDNYEQALYTTSYYDTEEAPKRQRPKKKKKKRSPQQVWRLRIYVAVITLMITAVSLSAHHIITLKMEQRALLKEQQQLEQRKEELSKELERVDDPAYIEQKAREQLHLIKPGEILYYLPEDDAKDES